VTRAGFIESEALTPVIGCVLVNYIFELVLILKL
jgi:hypothetical protein